MLPCDTLAQQDLGLVPVPLPKLPRPSWSGALPAYHGTCADES